MTQDWITPGQALEFLHAGTGAGIKIAVLDSGIETAHEDLAGLQLEDDIAVVEEEGRLATVDGKGQDLFGHGTAVAGILKRVAPEARIGSFRVLGSHLRARSYVIREGAARAMAKGYDILNCSFGCGREDHVLMYKGWVDEAYLGGQHIVAACNNADCNIKEWPGHFPTVITVNFRRGEEPLQFWHRSGHLVEFYAPGEDVEVPWAGCERKKVTGSSFATAHMAALVARVLSCCPKLSPLELKALLVRISKKL